MKRKIIFALRWLYETLQRYDFVITTSLSAHFAVGSRLQRFSYARWRWQIMALSSQGKSRSCTSYFTPQHQHKDTEITDLNNRSIVINRLWKYTELKIASRKDVPIALLLDAITVDTSGKRWFEINTYRGAVKFGQANNNQASLCWRLTPEEVTKITWYISYLEPKLYAPYIHISQRGSNKSCGLGKSRIRRLLLLHKPILYF